MKNDQPALFELLLRLDWLLRRRHMLHHRGRSPLAAPHQGQGRVLALLKLKPELSQKELSSILDIRSQSLGELLTKLERQGLITRTASAEDRRSMNVALTEAGRTASEQQEDGPDLAGVLDCLNEEEQTNLASYLQRLIAAFEAELGPVGPWAREGFGPPSGDPGFGRHGFGLPGFPGHGWGHGPGRGFGGPEGR